MISYMNEDALKNFISEYWRQGLTALLVVASLFVWGERFYHSHSQQATTDFAEISKLFSSYEEGRPLSMEETEKASQILKRHPELHPTYDISLAEAFFIQQKTQEGVQLALDRYSNTYKDLPENYQVFAKASLDLAEEKWASAYQKSLKIEESCKVQDPDSFLRALNLFRLCMLAKKLEKEAPWEALKQHACYHQIASLCQEGSISLENYIEKMNVSNL
jgi:hypothetical protein